MLSFYPQQSKNKKQIALQYQQKGLNLQQYNIKSLTPAPSPKERGVDSLCGKKFPPLG